MTLRMSDDLRDRAAVFAEGVGITLNALIVVAVNDYLALRPRPGTEGAGGATEAKRGICGLPTTRLVDAPPGTERKRGARGLTEKPFKGTPGNAPCPCGSGKKYKRCCGKEGHS